MFIFIYKRTYVHKILMLSICRTQVHFNPKNSFAENSLSLVEIIVTILFNYAFLLYIYNEHGKRNEV